MAVDVRRSTTTKTPLLFLRFFFLFDHDFFLFFCFIRMRFFSWVWDAMRRQLHRIGSGLFLFCLVLTTVFFARLRIEIEEKEGGRSGLGDQGVCLI